MAQSRLLYSFLVNYGETGMRKSRLLCAVCTLTVLAIISSANAAIITGDDTSITGTDQSYDPTLPVSPPLSSDAVPAPDMHGGFDKTQADRDFIMDETLPVSPHTNSHMYLWLFLIVAAVIGILSEIYHKRPFHR